MRSAQAAVPDAVKERVRLLLAGRLEARVRRSEAVRGGAIVLHGVSPRAPDPDTEIDPPVQADRLAAAVAYLTRRYALVRASDLPAAARARKRRERVPIALTFDDDLPSHRDHAAPILRNHGAVATAFLCGARSPFWWQLLQSAVDSKAIAADGLPHVPQQQVAAALDRRHGAVGQLAKLVEDLAPGERDEVTAALRDAVGDAAPPPLDSRGAAELAAAGWEIGFHTRRHDVLTALEEPALRGALEEGSRELGVDEVCSLAYPHGKAGPREARAARDAGYRAAYTGQAQPFTDRTDIHLIGRLQPDTSSVGRFALQLGRALADP